MQIKSFAHKGLERFVETDDSRALRADLVPRIRRVLTALILAPDPENIVGPPGWRLHRLTGDRAGTWSISVSGNWRITFDSRDGDILNLDLEDYH